jgi:hypothetical protein
MCCEASVIPLEKVQNLASMDMNVARIAFLLGRRERDSNPGVNHHARDGTTD